MTSAVTATAPSGRWRLRLEGNDSLSQLDDFTLETVEPLSKSGVGRSHQTARQQAAHHLGPGPFVKVLSSAVCKPPRRQRCRIT
jgi:hypothetical protein